MTCGKGVLLASLPSLDVGSATQLLLELSTQRLRKVRSKCPCTNAWKACATLVPLKCRGVIRLPVDSSNTCAVQTAGVGLQLAAR